MESQDRSLGCSVIHHASDSDVTSRAGYCNNMSFVLRDHVRQESFDSVPIAENIDIENLAQVLRRRIQDRVCCCDTRVIDEDGGRSVFSADTVCCGRDGGCVGDIAFEEPDAGVYNHKLAAFLLIDLKEATYSLAG